MGNGATVTSAQMVWKIEITYIRSYMILLIRGRFFPLKEKNIRNIKPF